MQPWIKIKNLYSVNIFNCILGRGSLFIQPMANGKCDLRYKNLIFDLSKWTFNGWSTLLNR